MAEEQLGKLFARIAKITGALGAIAKTGKSEQNYNFHSVDDIMGHLNPLMSEHGLSIIPSVLSVNTLEGLDGIQRWLVHYEFIIADSDGNFIKSTWSAEAPMFGKRKDGSFFTDDKAMGKAHTYALKYFLMKLFMISTVDTDDLDTHATDDKAMGKGAKPQAKPASAGKAKETTWEEVINTLIRPLYEDAAHHGRALAAAITQKLVNTDMKTNEAAAAILCHRAAKEFGFSYEDVCQAIGKAPEDLVQNKDAFYKVWQLLIKANEAMPM